MTKPDCYECKHRGRVAGSRHSSCRHPSLNGITDNTELQLLSMLSHGSALPTIFTKKLNIKGNSYGRSKGWFNFPTNFDPTWLENCDGFEQK